MKNLNEWLSTKVVKPIDKKSHNDIDPEVVLKVGDIVRIKDKEWFDSLEHDNFGYGLVKDGEFYLSFTTRMQEYLGEIVKITKVKFNQVTKSPRYCVELVSRKDSNDLDIYIFSNDMLEYL